MLKKADVESDELLNHFIAFKTKFVDPSTDKKSFYRTYSSYLGNFTGYTLSLQKREYKTFRDDVIAKMKGEETKYASLFLPEVLFSFL